MYHKDMLSRHPIAYVLVAVIACMAVFAWRSQPGECSVPLAHRPDPFMLRSAYSCEETLSYEVSWLGIKVGKLVMRILRTQPGAEDFTIVATTKALGIFTILHPVEDRFETMVSGSERLPIRYRELHRRGEEITIYDRQSHTIVLTKSHEEPLTFPMPLPVHNEFSSFLILRALPLVPGESLMIPTFADQKTHEVKVLIEGREDVQTMLGTIPTVRVHPQLTFKGLYDKTGDPIIWFTADERRIPVRIKAAIPVGSLTAVLTDYDRKDAADGEQEDNAF